MATGGYAAEKHSEEVLDFLCTPCSAENKTREAVKFCETCHTCYCSRCLSHHNQIFKNHALVEPNKSVKKSAVLLPTEQCGLHGNELVQMYCADHDTVGCNTCVSMHHRLCSKVVYIPAEIGTLLSSSALATMKTDLSTTIEALKINEKSGKDSMGKLIDKRNTLLEAIDSHAQMLKTIIDRLVTESKKEVEEIYQINKDLLEDVLKEIHENQEEQNQSARQLETAEKQKNDCQMFVLIKKGQARMTETEQQQEDLKECNKAINLDYELNKAIQKNLMKFTSLGSVTDQYKRTTPYEIKEQRILRVCKEGTKCHIEGSCKLPDGSFLLTDFYHKKVICLDSTCSMVTSQCSVPGTPLAVCPTGEDEAAVSLFGNSNNFILFISLGTKLQLTKTLKVDHNCSGLAFSHGKLFVYDSDRRVYVYNKAGNIIKSITTSATGNVFLNYSGHLAVSPDGQKLYVSKHNKGLECVDGKGNQLFKYKNRQLKGTHGVCTDNHGNIFVCGSKSNTVIQLSEDGQMMGFLLHDLRKPSSLCFDAINKRLLVTEEENNFISVFEFK